MGSSLRGLEVCLRKTARQESTSFLWHCTKPPRTLQPPAPLSLDCALPGGLEGRHVQGHCRVGSLWSFLWVMTDGLSGGSVTCVQVARAPLRHGFPWGPGLSEVQESVPPWRTQVLWSSGTEGKGRSVITLVLCRIQPTLVPQPKEKWNNIEKEMTSKSSFIKAFERTWRAVIVLQIYSYNRTWVILMK